MQCKLAEILFNEEGFRIEVGRTKRISFVTADVLLRNLMARLPPTPYGGFPIAKLNLILQKQQRYSSSGL